MKKQFGRKRIHYIPAWIGIVAIVLQINAVPLDYLLFRLNQGQIAKSECERKTPHCNGHCYLMKQLAKASTATNDKKTERFAQLDGQFVPTQENNLTVFPSSIRSRMIATPNIAVGWHSTLLQPPRFA